MTVFQCSPAARLQATTAIRVCSTPGYRPNLSTLRCELGAPQVCSDVKKGFGYCDVSAFRSLTWDKVERPPDAFCAPFNLTCGSAGQGRVGRRLHLSSTAAVTILPQQHGVLSDFSLVGGLGNAMQPASNRHQGRLLQSAWDDSTSIEVHDVMEPAQCNSYDVQLASQVGCWKPYEPFAQSWPAAVKTVAKAYTLTQQNSPSADGRVCTCTFQYACPVALSENCLGLARLRTAVEGKLAASRATNREQCVCCAP